VSATAIGPSVQQRFAPASHCFGCGPANEHGLRIESREDGDAVVADWKAQPRHEGFDGFVNGGILGALLDCHSNWTAALHLMRARGADRPPACVTADYAVHFVRPTPSDRPIHLRARVVEAFDDRATVEAELTSDGRLTATCRGTFVAVPPGHPAHERW